eukprot:scaffold17482_cov21-Prasinocladus_malaysianus.AAC.1
MSSIKPRLTHEGSSNFLQTATSHHAASLTMLICLCSLQAGANYFNACPVAAGVETWTYWYSFRNCVTPFSSVFALSLGQSLNHVNSS